MNSLVKVVPNVKKFKAYIDKVSYPKTISYREYKDLISQVADVNG